MNISVANASDATQLSTPPASSTSSTPSPSNPGHHIHASRILDSKATGNIILSRHAFQLAHGNNDGVRIFRDSQQQPLSSPSPIPATSETGAENPKRKSTLDPFGRGRVLTETRPYSKSASPFNQRHSMLLQHSPHQDSGAVQIAQETNQESKTPQPLESISVSNVGIDNPSDHASQSAANSEFWEGHGDHEVIASNKRPKSELRGSNIRKPRIRTQLAVKPRLSRHSTGSLLNSLAITGDDDDIPAKDQLKTPIAERYDESSKTSVLMCNDDTQRASAAIREDDPYRTPSPKSYEASHKAFLIESDEDVLMTPVNENIKSISNTLDVKEKDLFVVWNDTDQTVLRESEQTLVQKKDPQRAPLTDISLAPTVTFDAKPLAPLMTRQPRKATSRSRLLIVCPFPINHHYWEEYANDTFNYLLEIESRYDRYMYFDPQSEFGDYRSTLTQWMIELCYGWFELPSGTLHTAVNILDRYLATVTPETVHRDKLQCIGMCALMIAGKLEEPAGVFSTYSLCQLCDLYSTRELADMEITILKALKFEILVASALSFSDYFKRAILDHEETRQLIDFLCDLSLISHQFLEFNTCQIAASAVWISLCAVGYDWSEDLAILTGYSRHDLSPCSVVFRDLVCSANHPLDLRPTLGVRYPLDQTLTILRGVLLE
ncbi:G2/mitotic-specific cyclin-B3 [Linnemannia zychae]|nr:G2/mitotic-specific cyclin-B3 [Linnemannia zychae]